ncbi:MAG: AraC family transcriptional regulator, partial [Planctomycetes bacterium]|nr:AraC family transcriptional regulator [Planctomycetota bacterium]
STAQTPAQRTAPRPSRRTPTRPAALYIKGVNAAVDHIRQNLRRPLRLTALARIAGFSPYHFHRVFQAIIGETPADFVMRLRLDRAVARLAGPRPPPMARIATDCGFASASDFSRAFKRRFGASPSRFDLGSWRTGRRTEFDLLAEHGFHVDRLAAASNPDRFRVRLRDLPARTLAYIRVSNPYAGTAVVDACHRLMNWADRNGFIDNPWYGYQWENPELVPLDRCRYHVAVEADRFEPRGEIGRYRFPPIKVAEVRVRGPIDAEVRALMWLYGVWLPRSGYVPDDQPCFEAWDGRPFAHGMNHFELRIWLPVKRA